MSTAVEIACRDGVRLAGDHFPAVGDAREHRGGLRARRQARLLPALRRPGRGWLQLLLFSYRGSRETTTLP